MHGLLRLCVESRFPVVRVVEPHLSAQLCGRFNCRIVQMLPEIATVIAEGAVHSTFALGSVVLL